MLLYGIYRNHPRTGAFVRWLPISRFVLAGWPTSSSRIGCVRASTETALPLLAAGDLVACFPKG